MGSLRYYKYRWDETRGDARDSWGASTWYFEVGEDRYAVRQLEWYDDGTVIKYDQTHFSDELGQLGDQPIDLDEVAPFEIEGAEFEAVWSGSTARNR